MSGRAPGCQEEPSQLKGKRKSFPNLSFLKLHRCAEVLRAITGAQPPTHPDVHDRRLWQGRESRASFQGEIPEKKKPDPNSPEASLHQRKRGKSLVNVPVSVEVALPAPKSSLLPQPLAWSFPPWLREGIWWETLPHPHVQQCQAPAFMELQPKVRALSGSPRGKAKTWSPHRHFCSGCLMTVAKRQLRLAPSTSKWNSLVFSLFSPFPAGQQILVPAKYLSELPPG